MESKPPENRTATGASAYSSLTGFCVESQLVGFCKCNIHKMLYAQPKKIPESQVQQISIFFDAFQNTYQNM
jgi:hypothetical protein